MDARPVQLIDLPTHISTQKGGLLTVVEGASQHCPFEIKRIFFVRRIPIDSPRGGHAHKTCEQMLIMLQGFSYIHTTYGNEKRKLWYLDADSDRKINALYIPPKHRIDIFDFSANAILLVLASEHYDAEDYIYESTPN